MTGETETLRGVVDRIADGRATILVEGEVTLDAGALPPGAREGDVVRFDVSGGFVVVEVDEEQTAEEREALEQRMARLRAERSRGRFDRDADGSDGDD